MSPEGTSTSAEITRLRVPGTVLSALVAQAVAESPNECCGILAGGADGLVRRRYPLPNVLASPVEFESEAYATFAADKDMRANGWQVLAVYHSHPTSRAVPSRTDLQRSYGSGVVNLIVSLLASPPEVCCWHYAEADAHEVDFEVVAG